MIVVALDPGGETGWAMYKAKEVIDERYDEGYTFGTMGPKFHHEKLYGFLEMWDDGNMTIVCETFENRIDKPHQDLMAREYIGIVRLVEQEREWVKVAWQPPSVQGLNAFWDREKLVKVGLWVPGSARRHERSAIKHLLTWQMANDKHVRDKLLAKLKG